jgi:hypothetical protein
VISNVEAVEKRIFQQMKTKKWRGFSRAILLFVFGTDRSQQPRFL